MYATVTVGLPATEAAILIPLGLGRVAPPILNLSST